MAFCYAYSPLLVWLTQFLLCLLLEKRLFPVARLSSVIVWCASGLIKVERLFCFNLKISAILHRWCRWSYVPISEKVTIPDTLESTEREDFAQLSVP